MREKQRDKLRQDLFSVNSALLQQQQPLKKKKELEKSWYKDQSGRELNDQFFIFLFIQKKGGIEVIGISWTRSQHSPKRSYALKKSLGLNRRHQTDFICINKKIMCNHKNGKDTLLFLTLPLDTIPPMGYAGPAWFVAGCDHVDGVGVYIPPTEFLLKRDVLLYSKKFRKNGNWQCHKSFSLFFADNSHCVSSIFDLEKKT